ncbi:hypothetical protein B0A52_08537 [Exophiala mesophila]|uniref:DUF2293 domain-containing protein n=1 Tax=Exophiala mesophila TaxID=212818 RepID=A0A438MVZ9_EXOME|nr:hypothetical protein B0A52_08537 [Exophiala mesophila]
MARTKTAARKPTTRAAQVAKDRAKGKHKVTLQNDSKEKGKPLNSVITIKAEPPPGYTFIPAGNPELTQALKEFSRQGDHKIYAVTVCSYYGVRLTSGGKLIDESKDDKASFMQVYQNGDRDGIKEPPKDQITINTEAKQTLKDLFPKIPDKDLFQIIKTAFQLGDGKVGTAEEIPLVRRAQLAVVAHIRHIYTGYDKYLRQMPYNDARHAVERETLTKLIEWRGNDDEADEATKHAAADALREVIVISDEDDSDSGSDGPEQVPQDRIHVEELVTGAYAPISGRQMSPNPEIMQSGLRRQMLPQIVRRYRPTQDEIAQRDQSRYAVWDQAKRNYQSSVAQRPGPILERVYEPEPTSRPRMLVPYNTRSSPAEHIYHSQAPVSTAPRVEYEPRTIRPASPPTFIRDANGALYERVVTRPQGHVEPIASSRHQRTPPPRTHHGQMVRTRPSSPLEPGFTESSRHRGLEGNETILPSIEPNDGTTSSPRFRPHPFDRYSEPRDADMSQYGKRGLADHVRVDHGQSTESFKRRRIDERERLPVGLQPPIVRQQSPPRRIELSHLHYGDASPNTQMPDRRYDHIRHVRPQMSYEPISTLRDGTVIRRSMANGHEVHTNAVVHPSRGLPDNPPYSHGIPMTSPQVAELRSQQLHYPSRVYEPIPEPFAYEDRVVAQRNAAPREEYVQPVLQGGRPQYAHGSSAILRGPLDSHSRQRVIHYE